jgi:hypothetical protein
MYLCLKIRYDAMTCNDKETRNIKIIGATLYIYKTWIYKVRD